MPTRKETEAQVRADYETQVGKVVLLHEVQCYDAKGDSHTVACDPPAIGRIDPYSEEGIRGSLLHWSSREQCDPYLDVTILEPHRAFAGMKPSYVFGRCRNVDGTVEAKMDFEIADEAAQDRYRDAPVLDHETPGGCAPPAPEILEMKLERQSTQYSVAITTEDMLALLDGEDFDKGGVEPSLSERLEEMPGIDKVEYNGHFGANVFLRIEIDHDTEATHAAVVALVGEHIDECREALQAKEVASPSP